MEGKEEDPVLAIRGLGKSYPVGHVFQGRREVLKDLTFSVRRAEVFGYLGPNGSGKTTTLKLVVGLLFPDRGTIEVLGSPHTSRAWRYRAGYVPENPYLYDYLTAQEYLDYAGRLLGVPVQERKDRSRRLLELVGLSKSAGVSLRKFSKGMTQRVALAQGLINDPDLVILDEPMSGLDPLGRRLVRNLILDLKSQGKTVFFSTHILSDAESLCDRVALLGSGELQKVGTLSEILRLDISHLEVIVEGIPDAEIPSLPTVRSSTRTGDNLRLEVSEKGLGELIVCLEQKGGRILAVHAVRESLEDYFFRHLGTPKGDAD